MSDQPVPDSNHYPEQTRRLKVCVMLWPDCEDGEYDPRCCRFPKSCSCRIYDANYVHWADLEP